MLDPTPYQAELDGGQAGRVLTALRVMARNDAHAAEVPAAREVEAEWAAVPQHQRAYGAGRRTASCTPAAARGWWATSRPESGGAVVAVTSPHGES
jgi:hypothetical protein